MQRVAVNAATWRPMESTEMTTSMVSDEVCRTWAAAWSAARDVMPASTSGPADAMAGDDDEDDEDADDFDDDVDDADEGDDGDRDDTDDAEDLTDENGDERDVSGLA